MMSETKIIAVNIGGAAMIGDPPRHALPLLCVASRARGLYEIELQ
jgi:hypothetical protein